MHNLLNARILQLSTVCEIQNPEALKRGLWRKTKEGLIRDAPTVG